MQIIATVKSLNPAVNPEVPALIGASAALMLSGVPFNGPIAAARVGYKNGEYMLNPAVIGLGPDSDLDLVVAGTDKAVLMVESEARGLSEEVMLGAVLFGHEQMQTAIHAIRELAAAAGKPPIAWTPHVIDPLLSQAVQLAGGAAIADAYRIKENRPAMPRSTAPAPRSSRSCVPLSRLRGVKRRSRPRLKHSNRAPCVSRF